MAKKFGKPLRDPAKLKEFQSRLPSLMRQFYDLLFDDFMIGFLFFGHDKEKLIESQMQFTLQALGAPIAYSGPSLKQAHQKMSIFEGQFERRHHLLKQCLSEAEIDPEIQQAWLRMDRLFRDHVLAASACQDN